MSSFQGGEEMNKSDSRNSTKDEELIEVLTAISVVSMKLARKLTLLGAQGKSMEGERENEQSERHVCNHRGTPQGSSCY